MSTSGCFQSQICPVHMLRFPLFFFFFALQSGLPNGIFPLALMLLCPLARKHTLGMAVSSISKECEILLKQDA